MGVDTERDAILSDLENELGKFVVQHSVESIVERLERGVYIYGAGGFGRRIASLLLSRGFSCLGFIDATAHRYVDGIYVFALTDITAQEIKGKTFVLGIHNHYLDVGNILSRAKELGFRHFVMYTDLPEVLGDEANNYWLTKRSVILDNFDRLRSVARLLADAESFKLLCDLIRFRVTGDYKWQPAYNMATQYLPPDLPLFNHPITLIDGGAYTGDTHQSLVELGQAIAHWIAFEPDSENFCHLSDYARSVQACAILIPCALSDHVHKESFQFGNDQGSRMTGDVVDGNSILCLPLDAVIVGIRPDFIKLDVEGAEMAALAGMTNTIDSYRPRLAISAYHLPQDLWEIPERLAALLPDASIHLRQHAACAFGTVAYAIP